jgi:hypothetical protein
MGLSEVKMGISISHDRAVIPHADDTPNYNSAADTSASNSNFASDADIRHLPFVLSSSMFRSQSRSRDVTNIHTLRYVHAILYVTRGLVNPAYGFQLLLAMAYIFVAVVKYFHMVMISDVHVC